MSSSVIVMGKPGNRTVEQASTLLKRFYYVERESMRALAGYLVSVSHWDLKKNLPRHIWQDSLRADALRTRVLEMRYPRKDVDREHDEKLQVFASALIRCGDDAALIEGVYYVAKRALVEAYESYLKDSDPLDDAPTHEFMEALVPKLRRQLAEIDELYAHLPGAQLEGKSDWQLALESYLAGAGGLTGDDGVAADLRQRQEAIERPAYAVPLVPVRDPRFTPASYHMPPKEPSSFIERQVWQAINHINEIWAAEAPGMFMWEWPDLPWAFYMDAARWCYDESRHALMGEERLLSWGFEIGTDIPVFADHYISVSDKGPLMVLALLHRLESGGPQWKSGLKRDFELEGDTGSAQDFDYDWADESIHLSYGHKLLLHHLDQNIEAVEDIMEESIDIWGEWIRSAHQGWDYQPFMDRIRTRIAEIEAGHHG